MDATKDATIKKAQRPYKGFSGLWKFLPVLGGLLLAGAVLFFGGMRLAFVLNTTRSEAVLHASGRDKLLLFEPGIVTEGNEAFWVLQLDSAIELLDDRGRKVDLAAVETVLPPGTPVEVFRLKNGQVVRVRALSGAEVLEGAIEAITSSSITVSGKSLPVDDSTVFSFQGYDLSSTTYGPLEIGDVVRVSAGGGRALAVELLLPSGLVRVTSNVEGARVYADGKPRGKAPAEIRLAAGEHEIRVKASGHNDAVAKVRVEPRREIEVKLEPGVPYGILSVKTAPVDADVFIDGQNAGRTPLTIQVSPGYHDVAVCERGFVRQEERVLVKNGETLQREYSLEIDPNEPPELVRVTVVRTWADVPAVEVQHETGTRERIEVAGVPVYRGFFTTTWDNVLPGEEMELHYHPAGLLVKAVKTTANRFRLEGRLMRVSGDSVIVSDRFYRCRLNPDALVFRNGVEVSLRALLPGDDVVLHGPSADDIRYVAATDGLGERHPVDLFVVKTRDGFTVFSDERELPWLSPGSDLKLVDEDGTGQISLSSLPSGSRIRVYFDMSGRIVWGDVLFKPVFSEEAKVAAVGGGLVLLNSSWRSYAITEQTAVYRDGLRRSPLDIYVGDTVVVGASREGELRFAYVRERVRASRVAPVVLGWQMSKAGRTGWEIPGPEGGEPSPIVVNLRTPAAYPEKLENVPFQRLGPGDRLKLWLDEEDNVVWAEVESLSDVKIDGYYMGERDGKVYFTGFSGGPLSPEAVLIGLSSFDELGPGSRVAASITNGFVDYIEAVELRRPARYYSGTVLLVSGGYLRLYMTEGWVLDIPVTKDSRFVDWKAELDDKVDKLFAGDRVRVFVDSDMDYVWAERRSRPEVRIEGQLEAVYGRQILLGSKTYMLSPDAVVYKGGKLVTASSLAKGDKIRAAGPDRNNIEMVVVGW